MDLLDIVRACLRRWYVFFPIVLLTGYLAVGQYAAAQPQYSVSTSVLVVPSRDLIVARGVQNGGGDPVTTPFSGASGASSLAGVLRTALNTEVVRTRLIPAGGVALQADRLTEEDDTLVTITLVANDEARVKAALEAVTSGANGVLTDIQAAAGVPGNQMFVTAPGAPVDPPSLDYPDRLRAVVGITLAGTLAAVVLSVVTQALGRGRRDRKAKASLPRQKRQSRQVTTAVTVPGRDAEPWEEGPTRRSQPEIDLRGGRSGARR